MKATCWSAEQLSQFAGADDFQISPFYSDGKTYGTPTWIWSVVVNDGLYVRAWNGQRSRWHRSAVQQGGGRIFLAGANHEVRFEALHDETVNTLVDQAYRAKYAGSPYLNAMVQAGPRGTTMQVLPK
ncbi:DUF2255 family protein [Lactiplantibacillus garii]|uniref:DUF2255 family protein n=1 Tax=Lactiplantibacillus garii TaxID=2306423 RepID=UPI001CDD0D64|nr:DUF2255 family protein [Lactiplantibacillus garii]